MADADLVAMAEAIREWPQRVAEYPVRLDSGKRYHPVKRNIGVLRLVDEPEELYAYAISVIRSPPDAFETSSSGWDRICEQAGYELTWEWVVVDPSAPWASRFSNADRDRVRQWGEETARARHRQRG